MRLLTAILLPSLAAVCAAQAKPDPESDRVVRIYDVGDLLEKVIGDGDPAPARSAQPLVRLVRAFLQPPLQQGEEVLTVGERWIVAAARPEQHAWIDRFLEAARGEQAGPRIVWLECECFSVAQVTYLRDIEPAFTGLGGARDEEDARFLTQVLAPGENTDAFLRALAEREGVRSIHSQRLALLPLNVGSLAVTNQTSYISDFDVSVADNAFIADPIVDVIQDGILVRSAVAPLENGLLGVAIDAHIAELQLPIETRDVKVPGTTTAMTIQLPNLRSTDIESAVEMAPGHIVVLAPPPLAGERTLFVVRVTTGDVDDAEPPAQRRD